jgi:GT2 family glycosyltransferase
LLYAKNNNLGMKMSRARYACLLNSDTRLLGNVFSVLVRFMDAHPEAAACGPRLLNPDGTTQSCVRAFAGLGTMILQGLNWHKLFPNGQVSRKYYTCEFDYSREQQVESLGTTAYVVRLQPDADAQRPQDLLHAQRRSDPLRKPEH